MEEMELGLMIFPVFAGMVLVAAVVVKVESYFPRIRGDGPVWPENTRVFRQFSPYSRGWSQSL